MIFSLCSAYLCYVQVMRPNFAGHPQFSEAEGSYRFAEEWVNSFCHTSFIIFSSTLHFIRCEWVTPQQISAGQNFYAVGDWICHILNSFCIMSYFELISSYAKKLANYKNLDAFTLVLLRLWDLKIHKFSTILPFRSVPTHDNAV